MLPYGHTRLPITFYRRAILYTWEQKFSTLPNIAITKGKIMAIQYTIDTSNTAKQFIKFDDNTSVEFRVLLSEDENEPFKREIILLQSNNQYLSNLIDNALSIHVDLTSGYDTFKFENKILIFK